MIRFFAGVVVALGLMGSLRAQMQTGEQMKDFDGVFGLTPASPSGPFPAYTVTLIEDKTSESNILAPGQQPVLTFRVTNNTEKPIQAAAKIDVIAYGTRGIPGNVWLPQVIKIGDLPSIPITVDVPAKGAQNIDVTTTLPETFGAYAFVFDLGPWGRQFALSVVRTFAATTQKIQFPHLSLDGVAGLPILKSLGVQAIRQEHGWTPTKDPNYAYNLSKLDAQMKAYADNNITVLLTLESGQQPYTEPMGVARSYLDDKGRMTRGCIDVAWLPQYDADFTDYVATICKKFGWPRGPLTAVQLWNEPWEGQSISGWGADMPRYRQIYKAMADGVMEARQSGAQVLITGCDSSSNSMDKLFSDGKDDFLPIFDACTIHYQGLWSPVLYRKWRDRTGPNGRVKIWDTESWVANTDDRIPALIAGDRAAGYDRAMGVYWGNISQRTESDVRMPDGHTERVVAYFPWSTAASLGAALHFIGQREFRELLFPNGLPWVMVFDGENGNAEDGTIVVAGDLREAFNPDELLFRNVFGLAEMKNGDKKAALRQQIDALPASSSDRGRLMGQLQGLDLLTGGTMTFPNPAGEFVLLDYYGNPIPDKDGAVVVPLDCHGFYLRTNGKPGSFDRLLKAIAGARIEGYEPLNIVAHDFTTPIGEKPALHLTLTNILNRSISGTPRVTVSGLQLDVPTGINFQPHETKDVMIPVTGGDARPDNRYPLTFSFDAGADGMAELADTVHVNVIAHRTITVDGKLDDWKGVLPQTVTADHDAAPSLTQTAWQPFTKFDATQKAGLATGYLAYDQDYFYFAVKVADNTPSPGMIRFATRNDDGYYFPETSESADGKTTYQWPKDVRRFSYNKNPELPFGTDPKSDNVQIAFNVIPEDQKEDMLPNLPGVPPGFIPSRDTDYEYALNKVADSDGGGTEIWRCRVPGMPAKHFYPREPASPYDGAVKDGKLVYNQTDTTRIVEAAIPWSEIPLVKKALDANRTIKFSFRVNDDHGPSMELAEGRSVSKQNTYTFHPDWATHWSNEVEFSFAK